MESSCTIPDDDEDDDTDDDEDGEEDKDDDDNGDGDVKKEYSLQRSSSHCGMGADHDHLDFLVLRTIGFSTSQGGN